MFSTPCILTINLFFLFQLSARNMLYTYIYHLRVLPPAGFGVCYTKSLTLLVEQRLFSSVQLREFLQLIPSFYSNSIGDEYIYIYI